MPHGLQPNGGAVAVKALSRHTVQAPVDSAQRHVLLIDGEATPDGTFTSQEMGIGRFGPSPITYILDTSNIEDGLHSLVLVAKDQNGIEKRWATYLDIE